MPRLWGILCLLCLGGGCASQSVNVGLVNLAPVESTLFEQRLRLDLRLQNGSRRVIRATGFEITLQVNDRQLAQGVSDQTFLVTELGETRVSTVISTSLFQIGRQLLDVTSRETFSYELSGRIYLDGWPRSVPFTRYGEISRAELGRLVGADGLEPQPLAL